MKPIMTPTAIREVSEPSPRTIGNGKLHTATHHSTHLCCVMLAMAGLSLRGEGESVAKGKRVLFTLVDV